MDEPPEGQPKRIERVVLACVQCRSRHVKCDATQPVCNRCKRDGKECNYQKSRRGGLDKAALARRRLRLQQEAECNQQDPFRNQDQGSVPQEPEYHESTEVSPTSHLPLHYSPSSSSSLDAIHITQTPEPETNAVFHIHADRLLELFYEGFWPSFPFVLPLHHLQQRRLRHNHGTGELVLVLQYIGSIYAPWTPSDPYMRTAIQALSSPLLVHSPFVVQALMLLALALHHCNLKHEGHERLGVAINFALELGMNQRGFAHAYGESNQVLEESWRRTYYMLNIADQHLAIVSNFPIYKLANVPNAVDLPCDDEEYEEGQIPPVKT